MHEHPKALYRPGSKIEWEGRSIDMRIVHSDDEEATAKKEGWREVSLIDEPAKRKAK